MVLLTEYIIIIYTGLGHTDSESKTFLTRQGGEGGGTHFSCAPDGVREPQVMESRVRRSTHGATLPPCHSATPRHPVSRMGGNALSWGRFFLMDVFVRTGHLIFILYPETHPMEGVYCTYSGPVPF